MGSAKILYRCRQCGHVSSKWLGRCPACSSWNSFEEETARAGRKGAPRVQAPVQPRLLSEISSLGEVRLVTGVSEWDRVLGGGLVPGSLVLIAGDPGIGKSTLLLQVMDHFARLQKVLYISGEESPQQLKLRASRLDLDGERLLVLGETSLETICDVLLEHRPAIVAVDSIQTLRSEQLESTPGSVGQVREGAAALMKIAKAENISVFLVGHVTKEGIIAGPRVLEHLVDTVLYMEGDRSHTFRLLRAVKNRFGSTNEIGVFEMKESGLRAVANPSQLLLAERPLGVAGSVVVCSMEGTRPLLVELQALVSPTNFAQPRRTSIGIDTNRLSLLLAVLEKKLGLNFSDQDVFVNVAGGVRLIEPAADLAVITALISSYLDRPVGEDLVVWGEVGLAGEIRAVGQAEQRLVEAAKLGFRSYLVPKGNAERLQEQAAGVLVGVRAVRGLLSALFDDA